MALLQKTVQLLARPMPKVFSAKAHAVADYSTAASFLIAAALFWKRSKRAAVAALVCGATEAGVAAFTDYPGGVKRDISFPLHRKIDLGLASMVATMPEFLAFDDEKERRFFGIQAALIAVVTELTEFEPQGLAGEQETPAA